MTKQKRKLILIYGLPGSGKTYLAKRLCKEKKAKYINFDLFHYYKTSNNKIEKEKLLNFLESIIKTTKANTLVLDGFSENINLEDLIKELDLRSEIYFCFAAPHIIKRRQTEKRKKKKCKIDYSEQAIKQLTSSLFIYVAHLNPNLITVDTTNNKLAFIKKEDWKKRWMDLIFLSGFANTDNNQFFHYHRIELPSGIIIKGYSESEKTWERIQNLVDFSDKSILDIGCCYGYFSFKIEERGAKDIVGLEKNKEIIDVAKKIHALKKSKIFFKQGEVENICLEKYFDIILVLNMLHHVKNISKALDNIFSMGDCIIFEIPFEQEKIILEIGKKWNFQLSTQLNSHRGGREILVLVSPKNKSKVNKDIEAKYKITKITYIKHKKALVKEKIKSFLKKLAPNPVMNLYRKLRKKHYSYL
ncbi:MAG: methyltransferase domain-containing protein [Candidatus Pacebacteria bacterium]|nr:methyltransferase domain-containing protein [Candidatus Paceibacterota bacterium]MDD5722062.1 methyltransferase domain-containing protein [Candidatus Paceibacterota bacterium]